MPRTRLASLPTPLHRSHNLERALGADAPEIWIKLDAETGFALGGNKVRKLEYELRPDRLDGVTHLITSGGAQSNHARVTAAAAARLGRRSVLALTGPAPERLSGNALLHHLLGAEIRWAANREERPEIALREAERIEGAGGKALIVPLGASTPRGTIGYAAAMVELYEQLPGLRERRTWLFSAASSCGTLAGLHLGTALLDLGKNLKLVGVSADETTDTILRSTSKLASQAAELLDHEEDLAADRLVATADYIGGGYGIPTTAGDEATQLFASCEGIILDPVYTSKAAAGMLDWIRSGRIPGEDRVIFLHTGGHPALFR